MPMATQLTTSSLLSDRPDQVYPSKVHTIPTTLSQPRELSEGQHIPLFRDFINQKYICKNVYIYDATGLYLSQTVISI